MKEDNQVDNRNKNVEDRPFFNPYPIYISSKEKLITNAVDFKDAFEQTKTLKLIRGHFLDLIISLEEATNKLIENALLHKKSKLKGVFQTNILNHRNVTFRPKIELLCAIIKERKDLNERDLKTLRGHLDDLRGERDKWAHGPIFFRHEKKDKKLKLQSYLTHINNEGKESEIKLTNSYFDSLSSKLDTVNDLLTKVMVKRKLVSKELAKITR